jgi:hypothetical protein
LDAAVAPWPGRPGSDLTGCRLRRSGWTGGLTGCRLRRSGWTGGRRDEGAAALAGDDQAALAQHFHGVSQSLVRDAVFLGKCPLRWQLVREFADLNSGRNTISHLHIGEIHATERINQRHVLNVDSLTRT